MYCAARDSSFFGRSASSDEAIAVRSALAARVCAESAAAPVAAPDASSDSSNVPPEARRGSAEAPVPGAAPSKGVARRRGARLCGARCVGFGRGEGGAVRRDRNEDRGTRKGARGATRARSARRWGGTRGRDGRRVSLQSRKKCKIRTSPPPRRSLDARPPRRASQAGLGLGYLEAASEGEHTCRVSDVRRVAVPRAAGRRPPGDVAAGRTTCCACLAAISRSLAPDEVTAS